MSYTAGPFGSNHLYLQWGGKLPGNEQWSCGVRLARIGSGPWAGTDAAGMLAGAFAAISAFHTRATSQISNYCYLTHVKLNEIGTDGLYTQPGTNEATVADTGGVGATMRYPNQIALVATLRTGFSRGPAHAGRFYIPMPSMAVATDGTISTTDRDNVEASLATLRTNLNALSANYTLGVLSRKAGAPAQRAVTEIQVGRVLDTQRRRRRSLNEAFV